jgi:hypothetical protein
MLIQLAVANRTVFIALIGDGLVVTVPLVYDATRALALLSLHCETVVEAIVIVDVSDASNQRPRPEIPAFAGVNGTGPNAEYVLVPMLFRL